MLVHVLMLTFTGAFVAQAGDAAVIAVLLLSPWCFLLRVGDVGLVMVLSGACRVTSTLEINLIAEQLFEQLKYNFSRKKEM